MLIDSSSKMPLYAQVKDYVLGRISQGEWPDGFLLPTEQELQTLLGVSRVTVRRAIEELEREGYVKKKQGKGTYVTPPKLSYPLPKLTSFSEDMLQKGFIPNSRTIRLDILRNRAAAKAMGLPENTNFLYLRRKRMINGTILGIHDSHINISLLDSERIYREVATGSLMEHIDERSGSLYALMEQEYKVEINYADESLEAVSCTDELAELLNIEPGMPILFLERLTYSLDHQPLEYVKMYNRADIYKYSIRLTR